MLMTPLFMSHIRTMDWMLTCAARLVVLYVKMTNRLVRLHMPHLPHYGFHNSGARTLAIVTCLRLFLSRKESCNIESAPLVGNPSMIKWCTRARCRFRLYTRGNGAPHSKQECSASHIAWVLGNVRLAISLPLSLSVIYPLWYNSALSLRVFSIYVVITGSALWFPLLVERTPYNSAGVKSAFI